MKRLYHQFYLTIVASLVFVVLAAGALWRFAPGDAPANHAFEMAGELVSAHLAPADAEWRRSSRPSTGCTRASALTSVCSPAIDAGSPPRAARAVSTGMAQGRRMDLRPRRSRLGHTLARSALACCAAAAAAASASMGNCRLPRRDRTGGGDLRLSFGAPPHW